MELQLELEAAAGGGSKVVSLSGDAPAAELGRGDLGSEDRTVSRRHVSLRLLDVNGEAGVAFEVVGRNPVVLRRSSDGRGGSNSTLFRRGEEGELRPGDALSLSLKAPSFWAVRKKAGNGERDADASVIDALARRDRLKRERKERERLAAGEAMEITEEEEGDAGSELESFGIDLSRIDPVKEFGFVSMGHEFNSYPKGWIRPPKDWNWFLEEIKRNSDDEDDEINNNKKGSKGRGGNKKKKDGEGEDEDWTDESEDEKESLSRGPSVKRKNYVTRSKNPKKPRKENSKVTGGKNRIEDADVDEQEDEDDETLGGFIVNEEDEAMDELSEGEEEEEFDDEDDDD